MLYLTIPKSVPSLLPKVTLIYDPSRPKHCSNSVHHRVLDSAVSTAQASKRNSECRMQQELLRVILPADSAQLAIFFPRSPSPLFSVLDGVFARFTRKCRCRCLSLFLSLSLSPSSLSLSSLQIIDRSFGRFLPASGVTAARLLDEQSRRK